MKRLPPLERKLPSNGRTGGHAQVASEPARQTGDHRVGALAFASGEAGFSCDDGGPSS